MYKYQEVCSNRTTNTQELWDLYGSQTTCKAINKFVVKNSLLSRHSPHTRSLSHWTVRTRHLSWMGPGNRAELTRHVPTTLVPQALHSVHHMQYVMYKILHETLQQNANSCSRVFSTVHETVVPPIFGISHAEEAWC